MKKKWCDELQKRENTSFESEGIISYKERYALQKRRLRLNRKDNTCHLKGGGKLVKKKKYDLLQRRLRFPKKECTSPKKGRVRGTKQGG